MMGRWGTFKGDTSSGCGAGTPTCSTAQDQTFSFAANAREAGGTPAGDPFGGAILLKGEVPDAAGPVFGGGDVILSDGSVRFGASDFDLF